MSDLYDEDILLWSERQSTLLRRIAANEPVNERPDWTNIIEEVESVGRGDLRAVQSLLLQAILHMLKAGRGRTRPPLQPGIPMRGCSASRRATHSARPCGSGSILRVSTPMRSRCFLT